MATVIFKPTEACNARCTYCDVVHKSSHSPARMSFETLEVFFRRLDEYLAEKPDEHVDVIWHGGEPLALGADYFLRAVELQQKHCAETASRIAHTLQSNLTLLTRESLQALKKLKITSFGTSYDPIPNVRGLGSKCDSITYNRRFLEGISLLEDEGISWGFIYVVTKLSLADPLRLYRTLLNLSPKGAFVFNPVLLYGHEQDRLRVSPIEYSDFLGTIFPLWWERRSELSGVEPFGSLARNLIDGESSLGCCDSGECAYSHINVQANGDLSHCGRSADWGLLNYGSLHNRTLAGAFDDQQRSVLAGRNAVLEDGECKDCRFWRICHGGCPLDGWSRAGSFLAKSEWCEFKRHFIPRYFEPITQGRSPSGVCVAPAEDAAAGYVRVGRAASISPLPAKKDSSAEMWINPVGGLGDTLMISGILKQVVEQDLSKRFNLVDRTKYWPILEGHPAIARCGSPPPGAEFVSTAYWDHPDYAAGKRAYQVLATMFGLPTPAEERLYVAWEFEDLPWIERALRSNGRNVLICTTSESPRKQMTVARWEALVGRLAREDIGVTQVGRASDCYVRGAYSLLGTTTTRQLISAVRRFDAVVTSDSFVMHAAKLCDVPTVVLWGPTRHRVYGYSEHIHMQGAATCDFPNGCIGPQRGELYTQECPQGPSHCIDQIPVDAIHSAVLGLLQGAASR